MDPRPPTNGPDLRSQLYMFIVRHPGYPHEEIRDRFAGQRSKNWVSKLLRQLLDEGRIEQRRVVNPESLYHGKLGYFARAHGL